MDLIAYHSFPPISTNTSLMSLMSLLRKRFQLSRIYCDDFGVGFVGTAVGCWTETVTGDRVGPWSVYVLFQCYFADRLVLFAMDMLLLISLELNVV